MFNFTQLSHYIDGSFVYVTILSRYVHVTGQVPSSNRDQSGVDHPTQVKIRGCKIILEMVRSL